MKSFIHGFGFLLLAAGVSAEDPPRVVKLTPANFEGDVDPQQTTQLAVVFDRPMDMSGWSFCGGGPDFPVFREGKRPRWKDRRTCVVEVALEPDKIYKLSLNCATGQNFKSARGVPLTATPWTFATVPAKLPDPKAQRKLNTEALDVLKEVLESRYSYYELRELNWAKLYKEHSAAILASKSARGWAFTAAQMLEPTRDLHLWLSCGEDWNVPTGRRMVDTLHRGSLLRKYLAQAATVPGGAAGRTEDGIGYLMVATWSRPLDLAAVETELSRLRGMKAMVVDVRPSAGGDETPAQRVAAWFVKGTRVYAKNRVRTGKGKEGFGETRERSITGNEEAERRFDGPVAVLIGPHVMSTAEDFVLMMEQAPDCTTVGKSTHGSSGNPEPHPLPNGVTVFLSSWQGLLPDGTTCLEGKGIAPEVDVQVNAADLERRDPILEAALAHLRKKLKP